MTETRVYCGGCGEKLEESPDATARGPKPCPKCGSTIRNPVVVIEERIELHESFTAKAFPPGSKRWDQMVKSGESLYSKTGEWNVLNRNINKTENQYDEVIKTKDGKIIKECHEPLTKHQGHGSAKKTSKDKNERDNSE